MLTAEIKILVQTALLTPGMEGAASSRDLPLAWSDTPFTLSSIMSS